MNYIGELVAETAELVKPSERLTVSQAAEKYRKLYSPGAYTGPWKNSMAPYLSEPMDVLTSFSYTGEIFVGPAQSGKTEMGLNFYLHTVVCDPTDLMFIEATQGRARDFAKRRVNRLLNFSPAVKERILPGRSADNIFDKRFRSGALITLSWPTVNELSGKPIPRLFLTDYDRMDQDVGGDGAPFDLARARATTFGNYGMTVAESSPSFPILDPTWKAPSGSQEAPPTDGILALYNRGDRRRWMWACVSCNYRFEPSFSLMQWPKSLDLMECAEGAWMECPNCNAKYKHDPGSMPGKHELNQSGIWVPEGVRVRTDGTLVGKSVRSEIASFWLKGPAAAFKTWQTIVLNYLNARRTYESTGAEEALKTTTNVDQCEAYLPKSLETDRLPELLRERAVDLGEKVVPLTVVFLVASIDVQANRFVVQVQGVSAGGDLWIIDRFNIQYSMREDPDREGQFFHVAPGVYREDWRLLYSSVLKQSYRVDDESNRRMAIKAAICDSGGASGTTMNAYEFWRWLKNGPQAQEEDFEIWDELWTPGFQRRFALYKGDARTDARVRINFPDSTRKDRSAGARGEIPVMVCNSDMLKDGVDSILGRENIHSGRVMFPKWLPFSFYKELCVEVKDLKGKWVNPKGYRNESWDLLVMASALLISKQYVGIEAIDWEDPPDWASDWDDNPLVFEAEEVNPLEVQQDDGLKSLADLGRELA